MIYDKVSNVGTYLGINKNLDIAIHEIQNGSYQKWEEGHYEIEGTNVFCNVVHIKTKQESSWERHEKYLDIHIIRDGSEKIRHAEMGSVSGWEDYDISGDYAIAPYSTSGMDVVLKAGWFLIVFPQDAHISGLKYDSDISNKVIFKVKI